MPTIDDNCKVSKYNEARKNCLLRPSAPAHKHGTLKIIYESQYVPTICHFVTI